MNAIGRDIVVRYVRRNRTRSQQLACVIWHKCSRSFSGETVDVKEKTSDTVLVRK